MRSVVNRLAARPALGRAWIVVVLIAAAAAARGEMSDDELAKAVQNPVADLISVPFQNNTNFNVGPRNGTQNVLNIQPVIPFNVNPQWNVITRTILPVVTQPGFAPGQDSTTGVSDMVFSAFLSPNTASGLIWGAGLAAQLPTHSSDRLGNDRWGLGPTAVVLHVERGDPWVYGALVNNIWSVSSSGSDSSYNNFLLQPFVNYNFPGGVYLVSAPIITANWKADSSQRWIVPLGGGVGRIVRIGQLPVNLSASAFYNVVRPDNGPDWQLRVAVQFLFPR
jgi:hypothetical protein